MSTKKEKKLDQRQQLEAERLYGPGVSRKKDKLLLAVSVIACAMPMGLGLRLGERLPALVPLGLGLGDDTLPRALAVFGLPGLLCLLDVVWHLQLRTSPNGRTLLKGPVRLVGQFGFPILSVIFCSGFLLQAAGEGITPRFLVPCVLGLVFLLLGAHMWDCPKGSSLSLRFAFTRTDDNWRAVHRLAGWLWLGTGLVVLALTMAAVSNIIVAVVSAVAAIVPFSYGRARAAISKKA